MVLMCGIGGVVTRNIDAGKRIVHHLNRCQMHRGPDHAVVVLAGPALVGNTRLAINDLSPDGNQPLWSSSGRYCVVFNGEIYNFVELRQRYCLDTPNGNDGAVIPLLWEQMGHACLRELRGMFAIAVVDTVDRTLTLARDPFGIKPLVWVSTADGMAFASEQRALSGATRTRNPSRLALTELFRFGAPRAATAAFEGMKVVPPNGWMQFDGQGAEIKHGDIVGRGELLGSSSVARAELGELFAEAVGIHLRSDVPVALLLSGGVDSALLARSARGLGVTLDCITVTSRGEGDEAPAAVRTAGLYRHRHHVVEAHLDPSTLRAFFAAMQRPTVDGLNTFVVAKAVADAGLKVALSGLGGDEALGGYRHFRLLKLLPILRRLDRLPAPMREVAVGAVRKFAPIRWDKHLRLASPSGPRSPFALSMLQRELHPADLVAALVGVDVVECDQPETASEEDDFSLLVEAEIRGYLQTTLLPDADAFSMAHSVELRVPFLDVSFFGAAVKASVASHGRGEGQKEALVSQAGDGHIQRLAAQPKRGFTVPVAPLVESGTELVRELCEPGQPLWSWVDRDVALSMLRNGPPHRWAARWAFVVANAWLKSLS